MNEEFTNEEIEKHLKDMLDDLAKMIGHRKASKAIKLLREVSDGGNVQTCVVSWLGRKDKNWLRAAFSFTDTQEGHSYWWNISKGILPTTSNGGYENELFH